VSFPVAVLLAVFVLIALRRVGRLRLRIWQVMTGGAVAVLASGDIAPADAVAAVDPDVMVFLFGMFVVGEALLESGYLYALAYRWLWRTRSTDALVIALLLGAGAGSALLMNDTLAIVGTPLALRLAQEHRIDPRVLLLALAFAVTTGSVPSPIGNPQNLLIAVGGGFENPFVGFLAHLGVPTLLALAACYGVLRLLHRREFHRTPLEHAPVRVKDPALARLARLAVGLILLLIVVKSLLIALELPVEVRLSAIALAGALPILVASPQRARILARVDWRTLAFFAAMFVLMASVWRTGFFQTAFHGLGIDVGAPASVLGIGVLLSQLISNVPLVALYLPLLHEAGGGEAAMLALAAGSTLAGNLLILGAASNVIIVESAERRGVHLSFLDFARAGVPLTIVQVGIYWGFLGP
jgi:Na+/H+ antiporter NhaD/arsenite permease-like protein